YLFIHTKAKILKCLVNSYTLTKSSNPDFVGSVTIITASFPVIDDITEQPIPGELSIIIYSEFFLYSLAFFRSSDINKPEPSPPTSISALDIIPLDFLVIYISAVLSSSRLIASTGHTNVQAPQPSHVILFTFPFFIASNLHVLSHLPHLMQILESTTANLLPKKSSKYVSFPS